MKPTFLPLAALVSVTAVLSACGGGSTGSSGSTSNSTNNPTSSAQLLGTVQGKGSVVVNGVRLSTLGSTIKDEDGHTFAQSKLALGQVILVSGSVSSDGLSGDASQINLLREFSGPVQTVSGSGFALMGQNFVVDAATVFKGEAGVNTSALAQIRAGDYVEVYGVRQADGRLLATLVEEQTGKASLESGIEGRGLVSALNTTNKTFKIGNLTVNYSGANPNATLSNGVSVRVRATQDPIYASNGSATLNATSVTVKGVENELNSRSGQVEVKGFVESDANDQNPSTFAVAGFTVDVSNARFEGLSTLAVGQLVEVKGVLNNGVLQASKVETEESRETSRGGRYEFYGAATQGNYQASSNTLSFTVQGQNVQFSRAINQGSTDVCGISTTGSNPYVEVKGTLTNGIIQARKVECQTSSSSGSGDDRSFSGNRFEMEGTVSNYNASSNEFALNGTRVSVTNAKFKKGTASQLRNGIRVEVKGALDANQVFQATELEFED
ncbi:MAG: DUF5666 domain-containing protein [Limnobacter sp.]|nr:DUF5666 domain-containing protein [Limnobacter sp.]